MNLPPLFFTGDYAYARAASVDYKVEDPTAFLGLPVGAKRRKWRITRFGCQGALDSGPSCFCAQCCCGQIWVLNAARKLLPYVEGEDEALEAGLVAGALNTASGNSESGTVKALAAAAGARAAFKSLRVRRNVFSVLYDDWVEVDGKRKVTMPSPHHESGFGESCYVGCCPCCASTQEVDGIQAYAKERYGQTLVYGPININCDCCRLETATGFAVTQLPYPAEWDNLVLMQPPSAPSMAR